MLQKDQDSVNKKNCHTMAEEPGTAGESGTENDVAHSIAPESEDKNKPSGQPMSENGESSGVVEEEGLQKTEEVQKKNPVQPNVNKSDENPKLPEKASLQPENNLNAGEKETKIGVKEDEKEESEADVKAQFPKLKESGNLLVKKDPPAAAALTFIPLNVSQNSAVENYDTSNDGTNACVFFALSICDTFLQKVKEVESVSWQELAKVAEETITTLPGKINPFREVEQRYDPLEAKAILARSDLLKGNYELSEECYRDKTVFPESSRKQLINALSKHASSESKNHVGVYTCGEYTFLVGINGGSFFLVDTHPIDEKLGGNSNGILVTAPDTSNRSCEELVDWIKNRLQQSGVVQSAAQSFGWLTEIHKQDVTSNERVANSKNGVEDCVVDFVINDADSRLDEPVHVIEGQLEEAIKHYTKCIKLSPKEVASYTKRALCYLNLTRYDLAEIDCNAALSIENENMIALFTRAKARKGLGRYKGAADDLVEVLKLDGNNNDASTELKEVINLLRKQTPTPAVRTSEEYKTKKEEVEFQWKNGKVEAKDLYNLASLMAKWKPNDTLPVCLLCRAEAPKERFGLGHLIPHSILRQSKLGTFVDVSNGRESGVSRMGYRAFCSKCENRFSKHGEKNLNPNFFKKFHDQQDNELKVDFGDNDKWLYFSIVSIVWRCLCFIPSCEGYSEVLEDLRKFLLEYPNHDDDIDSRVQIYLFATNNELELKWKADNEAYERFFQEMYTAGFGCDDLDNAALMVAWVFMGPIHILTTYSSTVGVGWPPSMTEEDPNKVDCCRLRCADKTISVKKKQERFFPLSMYEEIVSFGKKTISQTLRIKMRENLTTFSMQSPDAMLLPNGALYENGTFSIPGQFTEKFRVFLLLLADQLPRRIEILIVGACIRGGNERVIFIAVENVVKYRENGETKYGPLAMTLKVNDNGKVSYLKGVHIPSKDKCGGYDFTEKIPFKEVIEFLIDKLIKDKRANWH